MSLLTMSALVLSACGAAPAASWPEATARDQVIYVTNNTRLYAVNASTSQEIWHFPNPDDTNIGGLFTEPAVSEDIIVVGSEGPVSSFSGGLFGLDPATGKQKWCLAFDQVGAKRMKCPLATGQPDNGVDLGFIILNFSTPTDNRPIGGIALVDGIAYFGLSSGVVFAVDVTGAQAEVKWRFVAQQAVWATPIVDGDVVYVASLDHHLYALNRADGKEKWPAVDLGGAIAGTPALVNGTLYIGSFDNNLHALDAATGKEDKWAQPFATTNWIWGGPVAQDGVLYFADLSGVVYAVNAETGVEKWRATLDGLVRGSPTLTADRAYLGVRDPDGTNGHIVALNLADGIPVWNQPFKGAALTSPLVLDDKVVVALYLGDNILMGYTPDGVPTTFVFAPSK